MYCCRCVRLGSSQENRLCPASAQPRPWASSVSDYTMSLTTSGAGVTKAFAVDQNGTVNVKVTIPEERSSDSYLLVEVTWHTDFDGALEPHRHPYLPSTLKPSTLDPDPCRSAQVR